jgi:hypothetical protein
MTGFALDLVDSVLEVIDVSAHDSTFLEDPEVIGLPIGVYPVHHLEP